MIRLYHIISETLPQYNYNYYPSDFSDLVIHFQTSITGEELPISTMDFVFKKFLGRGAKLKVYLDETDTKLVGVFYVKNSRKTSNDLYKIECVDIIGLLDDMQSQFYGSPDSVLGPTIIRAVIPSGFPMTIGRSTVMPTMSGYIPIMNAREALRIALQASGSCAITAFREDVLVTVLNDEVSQITDDKLGYNMTINDVQSFKGLRYIFTSLEFTGQYDAQFYKAKTAEVGKELLISTPELYTNVVEYAGGGSVYPQALNEFLVKPLDTNFVIIGNQVRETNTFIENYGGTDVYELYLPYIAPSTSSARSTLATRLIGYHSLDEEVRVKMIIDDYQAGTSANGWLSKPLGQKVRINTFRQVKEGYITDIIFKLYTEKLLGEVVIKC